MNEDFEEEKIGSVFMVSCVACSFSENEMNIRVINDVERKF